MPTPLTPEPERERLLNQVLADYLAAVDAGSPPPREELLSRYPELAEFLDDDRRLRRLAATPADLTTDDRSTADTAPAPRALGDYQLLGEIARGGMGVVFRAKQMSLGRQVAVKMILAGHLATDTDVQRFQREARAAANLDHPHIVPIYEVGLHDGQHYFSMKLIEGGSLASQLARLRNDPRATATLLATVARAVHFGHERGVFHRDLKPANILIDAAGEPHLTDFGLAKILGGESGLTVTGAVVGTPSYLAPELARGGRVDPSAATDVYSLGAILYEMLTGRPPFQGANAFETLMLALQTEPVRPRTLVPSVPPDLETICLKCLDKVPAQRYASAADLALDLENYVQGRPIAARPASRLKRWWRRPGSKMKVAAAVMLVVALGLGFAWYGGWFKSPVPLSNDFSANVRATAPDESKQEGQQNNRPRNFPKESPVDSVIEPPGELRPSREVVKLGSYLGSLSGTPAALVGQRQDKWQRVPPETDIVSATPLVSLPGFASAIKLDGDVDLLLRGSLPDWIPPGEEFAPLTSLGESAVVLQKPAQGINADLTLQRGRIYLTNRRTAPALIRLRIPNEVWDIRLQGDGTELALELFSWFPGELPFNRSPAPLVQLKGCVLAGRATVKVVFVRNPPQGTTEEQEQCTPQDNPVARLDLGKDEGFFWDSAPRLLKGPESFKDVQRYWSKQPPKDLFAKRESDLRGLSERLQRVALPAALVEAVEDAKASLAQRALAVQALGSIGELPPVVATLGNQDRASGFLRSAALFTLRRWISRGEDAEKQLFDPATAMGLLRQGYSAGEAQTILDLLHYFAPDARKDGKVFRQLVAHLESEKIAIRELAHWHLALLAYPVVPEVRFEAGAPPDERQRAVTAWKKLLDDGKLPRS